MASETVTITIDAINKARGALNEASQQLGALENTTQKAKKSVTDLAIQFTAAYLAMKKIVDATSSLITKYAEAERMEIRLAFALRQRNQYSEQNVKWLNNMATAISRKVAADDEEVKAVQAKLLQMGVQGRALERLTQLTYDWAAFTGTDATSAATQLGKAVQGNVRFFEQYRIGIKDTGTVAGNTEQIIGTLTARIGGMAGAEANSLSGSLRAAKIAWDEMTEAAGGWIALSTPLREIISGITFVLEKQADALKKDAQSLALKKYENLLKELESWQEGMKHWMFVRPEDVERAKELEKAVHNQWLELVKIDQVQKSSTSLSQSVGGGGTVTRAASEAAKDATKKFFEMVKDTFKTQNPLGFLLDELNTRLDQLNEEFRKGTIKNLDEYARYKRQIEDAFWIEENKLAVEQGTKKLELEDKILDARRRALEQEEKVHEKTLSMYTNLFSSLSSGNVASIVPSLGQMFGMAGPMGSMIGGIISLAQNLDKLPGMIADSIKSVFSGIGGFFKNWWGGIFGHSQSNWDRYREQIDELIAALKQNSVTLQEASMSQDEWRAHFQTFLTGGPGSSILAAQGTTQWSRDWLRDWAEAQGATLSEEDITRLLSQQSLAIGPSAAQTETLKAWGDSLVRQTLTWRDQQLAAINKLRDAELSLAEERLNAIKTEREAVASARAFIGGALLTPQQTLASTRESFMASGTAQNASAYREAIVSNWQAMRQLASSGAISQDELAAMQKAALANLATIDAVLAKSQASAEKDKQAIEALRTKQIDEANAYLKAMSDYLSQMKDDLKHQTTAFLGTPMPTLPATPHQTGGFIGSSGLYFLHRGETVNAASDSGFNITINVGPGVNGSSFSRIVRDELLPALKSEIQLNRRGIRTALKRAV